MVLHINREILEDALDQPEIAKYLIKQIIDISKQGWTGNVIINADNREINVP